MKYFCVVILLVMALAVGQLDDFGSCSAWSGSPKNCDRYIEQDKFNIFVPANGTQPSQVKQATTLIEKLNTDAIKCVEEAKRFICASGFRPCLEERAGFLNISKTVGVPRPLCKAYCQEFANGCGKQLAKVKLDKLVPDCSDDTLYPTESTVVDLGIGKSITVPCYTPPKGPKCKIDIGPIQLLCSASALHATLGLLF